VPWVDRQASGWVVCCVRRRLVLTHQVINSSSLRFSGDTVPSQKLVQAGAGATLLIHEATMADDQVEMARAKMHSTFGQAIETGKRCVPTICSLTFSQTYQWSG
jgi:ribonuclease BN (tRNA processing enzyme)